MKNFSTWLLVMFVVMFWAFRLVVAFTYELAIDFGGVIPLDMKTEVILLFLVLVCLGFIIKRKIVGGVLYLITYGLYFGKYVLDNLPPILAKEATIGNGLNLLVALVGLLLPILVLFDLLVDRNRKTNPVDKKTDWYYKNEEYDRKLDDRADKNNYRTL